MTRTLFRVALSLTLTGLPAALSAQAVERNLPPAPSAVPSEVAPPNLTPSYEDDTPLGTTLRGILLLGPDDVVRVAPVDGVNTALVPRMNVQVPRAVLGRFIGRPLSRRLIGEVEAAVARQYREIGFPFVSLSTPPQVIGSGMLQIRVTEFHVGQVTTQGARSPAAAAFVRSRIRLEKGDPIDARRLAADLDWLNRYPFRRTEAVFAPGDARGETDLELAITETKPWQVFAGWSNSGSPSTGRDRLFAGLQIGGLLGRDSLVSYQFTGSRDAVIDDGRVFENHPRYISHGARASLPTGSRSQIEASYDHIETNVDTTFFTVRQKTDEASLGYRFSLSSISNLPGDLSFGAEWRAQKRTTFFLGFPVLANAAETFQAYLGWSHGWLDRKGQTAIALTGHLSPGRLSTKSSDASLDLFTANRVLDSRYAYATFQVTRATKLPHRWTLTNSLLLQIADKALPDTAQLGLGGSDLVRGYTLDDGAYDRAVVVRNELHIPVINGFGRGVLADVIAPYVFFDIGAGDRFGISGTMKAASTGVGTDYRLGRFVNAGLSIAYTLKNSVATPAGTWRAQGRVSVSF